jgi:hypothetical protein
MLIRAAVSLTVVELASGIPARTGTANKPRFADVAAGAAVVGVRTEVDASGVTPREPGPQREARIAAHGAAVRVVRIVGSAIWVAAPTPAAHLALLTDLAASTAVVSVRRRVDTHAVAGEERRHALVAQSMTACRGFAADVATGAAVVGVIGEVDA